MGGIIGVVFLLALPFFVMRGLRFRARVTSYRNVRFDFRGGYGGAFLAYLLGGLLAWGTLGLLAPIASQWMWQYMLGNLRYGDRPVQCDPRLEKLYGQLVMPALVFVGGSVVIVAAGVAGALGYSTFFSGLVESADGPRVLTLLLLVYLAFLPFVLVYVVAGLIYRAGTRNVALNETVIDGRHLLASSIGRWRYAWIAISNFLATLCTLGLARPWAAVRMARYLASVTVLYSAGSLDDYMSTVRDEGPAVGAEYMDFEGFDFGF